MSYNKVNDEVFGRVELAYAADAVIATNDIVVMAGGYAEEGTTATGLVAVGISVSPDIDNTGGGNGAATTGSPAGTVVVETSYPKSGGLRMFWLKNDSAGGAVAQTDLPLDVYVKDAKTVTKTSSGRSKAGRAIKYDATNDLVGVVFNQWV